MNFLQLRTMNLKDVQEMLHRLSGEKPTQYGTARIWLKSRKAAVTVAQYLVTVGMVKPLSDIGRDTLEEILNSWSSLQTKNNSENNLDELRRDIRSFIEHAESAEHIYIFSDVVIRNVSFLFAYYFILNN